MSRDNSPYISDTGPRGSRRYGIRQLLFAGALLLAVGPFLALLLLVEDSWAPLDSADRAARDGLHRYALTHPGFVSVMRTASDVGSGAAWQIVIGVVALWLLWHRLWRLAAFAVVTTATSSLLNSAVKVAVHRTRPVVSQPFVNEPGASFPSGHSQAAVVGFGVLLLVFLPVLGRWARVVAVTVSIVGVVMIGFSRIALAAHYVSDVVAGFVLGAAWLAALTGAFNAWNVLSGGTPLDPSRGARSPRPGAANR